MGISKLQPLIFLLYRLPLLHLLMIGLQDLASLLPDRSQLLGLGVYGIVLRCLYHPLRSCARVDEMFASCQSISLTPGPQSRLYTLLLFGGRQPLCGTGVTSRMVRTSNPAADSARTADSRPDPGPLTRTSTLRMP